MHIPRILLAAMVLLFQYAGMEAKVRPFRFAQLTDIHLNPNAQSPTESLMRSIEQINATDSIDFVLLTGDLTEQGDRSTLRLVKQCIGKLKVPCHVVLGNHETTWSDSGCTAFQELFGPETYAFSHNGVRFVCFNSGPLMRMAFGHVSPADIQEIGRQTAEAAAEGEPVVMVTHYPMLEGDVDNWYDVTDTARKAGSVRLFIGGHYHAVRQLSYDGIPGLLMRSNLPDEDGLPGYGIYEVDEQEIRAYVQRIGEEKKHVASYPLQEVGYDTKAKAGNYPDYRLNLSAEGIVQRWNIHTDGAFYSSPAVEKQRVFTGDNEGVVKAFDAECGRLIWQYRTGARIVGGPAVERGIVVCGSADSHIYGLRAEDGSLMWKISARGPVLGAVAIDRNIAYIGASDSTFRAIDIRSGRLVWEYRGLRGYVVCKPLLTADKVIFGAWDNTLYALDRKTGHEQWKWTGGLTRMHFSPASVWPQAANGKVFIVDPQRAMTAIDLKTGQTIWRTFGSMVRESMGISADGKRVYAKTMQDSVVCYSTQTDTPRELWACHVGFGYEHGPCMLQEKDGTVFGSTKDGLVFAIEGHTGQLLWKYKIGNSLMSTPVPVTSHKVFYSSTDGQLGLLEDVSGQKKSTRQRVRRKTHRNRPEVMTGLEVLKSRQFKCLEGKRVGLITNPTGVDNGLRSTVDILFEAPQVNLVALFGPEHGVRGNAHAGDKVEDLRDARTGLPVRSLYGRTRKPTPEMLEDIDVLVYDIQDVGCRSFTYISTMGLAMEAAAENGKEFIVLDRPNPLGGEKMEGCLAEPDCISFVSPYPIPYVYGLTCGELALMINGEHFLPNGIQCPLKVIEMKGWHRKMTYAETGLPWVLPSPHIPQPVSACYYPVSGIIGELYHLSIGVGYTMPFQLFAAPWVQADSLAQALQQLHVPGVEFRPIHLKPFYSTCKDEQIQGVQVHFTDYRNAPLSPIQFIVVQEMARLWPQQALFLHAPQNRYAMFDKVCGSRQVRERFAVRHRWADISDYWSKDIETFRKQARKYMLYK